MADTAIIAQSDYEIIQAELRDNYPTLHIFTNHQGLTEVAGCFPIRDVDGKTLDKYDVSIILPPSYPIALPIVYEVGGRISRVADRHIFTNGSACIFMPDDRWRCFPEDSSFMDYLNGPLRNFFLSQTYYEQTGQWPFGEWSHDDEGIWEYYRELIGTEDPVTVIRFLIVLSDRKIREQYSCPCGSGKKLKRCCRLKVRDLRKKIDSPTAIRAFYRLMEGQFIKRYMNRRYAAAMHRNWQHRLLTSGTNTQL